MIRLFSTTKLNTMNDLLMAHVHDLYDAENQLVDALPKIADAAHSPDLKVAINEHLRETEGHVTRLNEVFRLLGKEPERESCEAMEGLIEEGEEMIKADGDPAVKDAALIAAAQKVEHYEISGYGSARTFAQRAGHHEVARLLDEILVQEKAADKKLTQIAESSVNVQAQQA